MVPGAAWLLCLYALPLAAAPAPVPSKTDFLNYALRHEGNATRGQALFQNDPRLGCSRCHTVDGHGGKAGPDLFAVGDKYGRRELVEAILNPSATIAVGYSTTTLRTRSGDEYSGIVKLATDSAIELLGSDAQTVRVATADLAEQFTSDVSLMPEGLEAGLSLDEFADLIEFLVHLQQPQNRASTEHGMPSEIKPLARPVTLQPFFDDTVRFEHPVWFGPVPGQSNVFLVVEHETGRIWRVTKGEHQDAKTLFVDLGVFQTGTRGLLGMALHPRFRENRKYYFARHTVNQGKFSTLICEREATPDLTRDSGAPARILLELREATNVHYGGGLAFGPDGLFYIGMGDSGPQEDPQGHAQNPALLLGKMLRIDVDHSEPGLAYAIPPGNPFRGRSNCRPEIWALGLREPWRFSFDPLTRDLWVGDVGQDRYEEVDVLRSGENYGWNVYEGFEPFSNRYRRTEEIYTRPLFAYTRKYGVSVTGGFVYRGDARSPFFGVYVFGDYESRRLFGLTQQDRVLGTVRQIGRAPQRIVSFGRDERGALYVVGYEGVIYQVDFARAAFP